VKTSKKRGKGRPPLAGKAGERFQIHLPPHIAKIVKRQGNGSISAGILWSPIVMRELKRKSIRDNEKEIEKLQAEAAAGRNAAVREIVRLQRANEELSSLIRMDEAWERRQEAYRSMLGQFLPHGSGAPTMESLDAFDKAEADWKAAKAEGDRIVREIQQGLR
jgi:hypothetical protein